MVSKYYKSFYKHGSLLEYPIKYIYKLHWYNTQNVCLLFILIFTKKSSYTKPENVSYG